MELYRKRRPTKFKDVVGQSVAVKTLAGLYKRGLPHAILFHGPSGCGKTTLARILMLKMGCDPESDCVEKNSADFRGIDMVRDISKKISLSPIKGDCRVYIIDEVHQATGACMEAFLKVLEEAPDHAYFFLVTTNPEKLRVALRNRCVDVKLESVKEDDIKKAIHRVCQLEKLTISEKVLNILVSNCDNSVRQAMQMLEAVVALDNEEDRVKYARSSGERATAIAVVRKLCDSRTTWKTMSKMLTDVLKSEEPERFRQLVLAYATTIVLSGEQNAYSQRAAVILDRFESNFYDSGKAGLVLACHDMVSGKI